MLIKVGDRMTADGFLALRAFKAAGESVALQSYLHTVREASTREGNLAFHADPSKAIRFFWDGEDGRRAVSVRQVRDWIFPESGDVPVLLPVTAALQGNAVDLDKFLPGEAHEQMAFTQDPLLLVHTGVQKSLKPTLSCPPRCPLRELFCCCG